MELAVGHHAATRQSYRDETSMKELITRLRDEYPQAAVDEIIRRFAERARTDEEYLNACVEHAVVNTWNTMERLLRQSIQRPAPHEAAAQRQERETKVQSIKEQIMLLNLEMPNGKRMRWCTGAEMKKFGGAYVRIGEKVGRSKTVGQVLSEDQVKAIMK